MPRPKISPAFHPVMQHFEATGDPGRLKCKRCPWTQTPNVSRLKAHILQCPGAPNPPVSPDPPALPDPAIEPTAEPDQGPSKKRSAAYATNVAKKHSLTAYFDRTLTGVEQDGLEEAQAYMAVMCSLSQNSMDNPAFHAFLRRLKSTYVVPSRFRLGLIIEKLEKKVATAVLDTLQQYPWVNLGVDGWEDHQKHPSLAFTDKAFLWPFVDDGAILQDGCQCSCLCSPPRFCRPADEC